jgi:mannose-6-phosphate isomerase-like protein (cupin superfamily)
VNPFEIEDVIARQEAGAGIYREFIREESMSVGVATFAAGELDTQDPHDEDEIYYVVRGEGAIEIDGVDHPVRPGSVVFVGAEVDHRFHSVTEDIKTLVVFAPAVGSRAAARKG